MNAWNCPLGEYICFNRMPKWNWLNEPFVVKNQNRFLPAQE
jgi:hypothetical protein